MVATRFIQPLISILTRRGRQTRTLARDFNLELADAFSLVKSSGSVELARIALEIRKDEQKRLSARLWDSPNRYATERPGNTSASGARLAGR